MKKIIEEKEVKKKNMEIDFESIDDFGTYVGKIKMIDIDNDDYILTIYKKGSIVKKLRRVGVVIDDKPRNIKYRQLV